MHTVAFDFSGLDHLNPGNGQYRYCTDLIRGLARLHAGLTFVVIGSQPQPPPRVAGVFDAPNWRYAHLPRLSRRGAYYFDHFRFAWFLRRERVSLFHTPHTFLPLASSIPAVVTIYDLMSEMFPEYEERVRSRPYRLFKHSVTKRGAHVIAISQTTADDVHRYWHVPVARISTVLCGFDMAPPFIAPGSPLAALAATPFVLSPYNLEPRKNLRALLLAMAQVRRAHPDVRLVLYGRAAVTPDREEGFQRDLRDLGLAGTVVCTGFISDQELAALYRQSTLFVFPSLYEGFGIPVLEAMSAGSCVIARNQSAMAEVLGDAGVQIETKNPDALAAAMCALLGDPARRAELGRAAQARAARFSQDAMARDTLAVYMRALERR